ncbi:MAG: type II toxin-antitoxin system HicA family toxin [Holophagales bacterium]|nr:type II toxin-antitoxin system HicA family toxin [Holophagales bacterium]
MNFREAEKIVKKDGWRLDRIDGSHYQYVHSEKKGLVTIPRHKGELKPKTVESILKQAGLK